MASSQACNRSREHADLPSVSGGSQTRFAGLLLANRTPGGISGAVHFSAACLHTASGAAWPVVERSGKPVVPFTSTHWHQTYVPLGLTGGCWHELGPHRQSQAAAGRWHTLAFGCSPIWSRRWTQRRPKLPSHLNQWLDSAYHDITHASEDTGRVTSVCSCCALPGQAGGTASAYWNSAQPSAGAEHGRSEASESCSSRLHRGVSFPHAPPVLGAYL